MRNHHFDHEEAPLCILEDGLLAGLRHRTVIDAATGAAELALWQEEHMPGFRVPLHYHDCEEIITVLEGEIEATIGGDRFRVRPGQSILIPARVPHGFRVLGNRAIRVLAIFSSSCPKIFREDGRETTPPWEGGSSDHLQCTAAPGAAV